MKANIELHIEEMVLRGLPYSQRYAIAAAVEVELQRLLDEGGLPPGVAADLILPEVQIGDLRVPSAFRPDAVGAQIAASIYNNLAGSQPLSSRPERSQG